MLLSNSKYFEFANMMFKIAMLGYTNSVGYFELIIRFRNAFDMFIIASKKLILSYR